MGNQSGKDTFKQVWDSIYDGHPGLQKPLETLLGMVSSEKGLGFPEKKYALAPTTRIRFNRPIQDSITQPLIGLEDGVDEVLRRGEGSINDHDDAFTVWLGVYVKPRINGKRFGKVEYGGIPKAEYLGMQMALKAIKPETGAYTGHFEAVIIQVSYRDPLNNEPKRRVVDSTFEPAILSLAQSLHAKNIRYKPITKN